MYNFPRFVILMFAFLLFHCEQFSNSNIEKTNDNTTAKTDFVSTELISNADNEFLIKGTSFSPNDTYVYLFKAEEDSFELIDSTTINDTKFQFRGLAEVPLMYLVSEIRNKNKGYPILVDNSEIHLFLNKRMDFSTAFSNSKIQKKYQSYTSQMTAFKDKGMSLYYALKGDFSSKNIKKLKQERLQLFTAQNDFVKSFIKEHSDSYFSAMLIKQNVETYSSKTLRTLFDGLSKNIKALTFSKSVDSLIIEKEATVKERLPVVVVKKIEKTFEDEYRPKAYKLNGLNPYGEAISLNSIPKGKVILIDFWASWCAPCRATNPNLVALHNKYKSKGFEILSVSEDKGEAEWLNAIAMDGLTWDYHIIDKNKSIAFRYGVESIPFKLLIDKQGRIASEKISGRALESRIQELLSE